MYKNIHSRNGVNNKNLNIGPTLTPIKKYNVTSINKIYRKTKHLNKRNTGMFNNFVTKIYWKWNVKITKNLLSTYNYFSH